jgi:hypothetical protein
VQGFVTNVEARGKGADVLILRGASFHMSQSVSSRLVAFRIKSFASKVFKFRPVFNSWLLLSRFGS